MALSAALVADLRATLPPAALVSDSAVLPSYGEDFWTQRGIPGVAVRATSSEMVAATLRIAARHQVPVVPRAAGTNVPAGFLPDSDRILLDLRPLNRILTIDPERREAVVEAGVINGDLNRQLAPLGLCFSPDPASAAFSSIGGNIAENAGGPHCLKYGVTVHHVTVLNLILAGGESLHLAADDHGPDLLGAVIGSEGTLGVVTEATVALRRLPEETRTLLAIFDDATAAATSVSTIIAAGVIPAALEYCDGLSVQMFERYAPAGYPTDAAAVLLIDIDGTAGDVAREMAATEAILRRDAREVRRADDADQRAELWRGRVQGAQALLASGLGYFICDTTVPRECIPEMQRQVTAIARRHGLLIPMLGHAGDGNIHPIILYDRDDPAQYQAMVTAEREITVAAIDAGGTITGEHGVGSEKIGDMARRFRPAELAAFRALKRACDPDDLLNPGILLPAATADEPALPRFASALRGLLDAHRAGTEWSPPADGVNVDAGSANREISLDSENLTVTVNGTTPLSRLHDALAARGFRSALPVADDLAASVGALIVGGHAREAVRETLLALQIGLVDGPEAQFGSNAVKDVAGYDLKRLFIGGGSAFGTVHAATFQVRHVPMLG